MTAPTPFPIVDTDARTTTMRNTDLTHVRISGEASASDAAWFSALNQWARGADVVDLSECGSKRKPLAEWAFRNNFVLVHSRERGQSENAVLVANHFGRVVDVRQRRLTRLRLRSARKAPLFALKVQIQALDNNARVWDTCTHLPAHSEGRRGLKPGWSSKVYRAAALGWSETRFRGGNRIISADWNLDHRKRWVRAYLNRLFPGTRPGWDLDNLPKRGTIGPRRLIDGPRSNLPIVRHSEILASVPGFKHRGVRTVYRLEGER